MPHPKIRGQDMTRHNHHTDFEIQRNTRIRHHRFIDGMGAPLMGFGLFKPVGGMSMNMRLPAGFPMLQGLPLRGGRSHTVMK